jgi:cell division protein FtsQ
MLKRILTFLVIALIAGYALFAFVIVPTFEKSGECRGVIVKLEDNEMEIISSEEIAGRLKQEGLDPTGRNLDEISCGNIESFMNGISLVDECQVYKSIKGYVVVDVDCRIPVIRIHDKENRTYYVDNKGNIMHGIDKALYLPVASGHINDSIAANDVMMVARAIGKEKFWKSQIEQIYFEKNGKIIMVPRVGNHIIELGPAEELDKKLEKLYSFYQNGMNSIGWNKYSRINVEFSDKVICTKRDRYGKN